MYVTKTIFFLYVFWYYIIGARCVICIFCHISFRQNEFENQTRSVWHAILHSLKQNNFGVARSYFLWIAKSLSFNKTSVTYSLKICNKCIQSLRRHWYFHMISFSRYATLRYVTGIELINQSPIIHILQGFITQTNIVFKDDIHSKLCH